MDLTGRFGEVTHPRPTKLSSAAQGGIGHYAEEDGPWAVSDVSDVENPKKVV